MQTMRNSVFATLHHVDNWRTIGILRINKLHVKQFRQLNSFGQSFKQNLPGQSAIKIYLDRVYMYQSIDVYAER